MSGDLAYLGLAEAAELISAKKLSPVEYVTALLARIERPVLRPALAAGTQPVEPRPFLRRLIER